MTKVKVILFFFICCLFSATGFSQNKSILSDTLIIKGQLSAYTHYNNNNNLQLWLGARYIPQINYNLNLSNNKLIDFEFSANIFGNGGIKSLHKALWDGQLKPYRAWARYSTKQLELRVGLQKINFGSASMLRPLMWFDQIDPRDPLRLTDGVWGILGRYYFLNNANIWFWGLYGNKNKRGWEAAPTAKRKPEFGGRIQLPVPKGEAALSFHHRKAYYASIGETNIPIESGENRIGFDARFDMTVGWWIEGSLIASKQNIGMYTNQTIANIGVDYTFGFGSGLYAVYEQLFAASNEKAFNFSNSINFSMLSLAYPVSLFDNLSAIFYFNWENQSLYNFLSWQKQFNNITWHTIIYWNPENYQIPTQGSSLNLFGGFGIQLMFVFNH